MNKKFLCFLLIFIFLITGCSTNNSNKNDELIEFLKNESIAETKELKELILNNLNNDILKNNITNIYEEYLNKINDFSLVSEITKFNNEYKKKMYDQIPNANNESDFSNLNQKDKEEILVLLDKYLYRTNLIGIPLTSSYSLNLNSTSIRTWEYFFGENGIKTKTTKENYWDIKPILSNKYFIKGLNLCIDKDLFKNFSNINLQNSIDYSNYDYYDYNLIKAKKYFRLALIELIETKVYTPTISNPTILNIEIAYGSFSESNNCEEIHNIIKKSIEDAFNVEEVTNGKFILNISSWTSDYFGQIYSEKLYVGKFDVSFDKISGSIVDSNEYKNYILLSSNNDISNNLTTNWSIDTSKTDIDCIVYNGYKYSYDEILLALLKS